MSLPGGSYVEESERFLEEMRKTSLRALKAKTRAKAKKRRTSKAQRAARRVKWR